MARPSGKALNPAAFHDLMDKLDPPLSRSEVCKLAGIATSTLSEYLAGATRVAPGTAASLANALQCDKGTLFPEFVQFGARPRPDKAAA